MEQSGIETGTVLSTDGAWATVITNKNSACRECGKAQAGICGKKGDGIVMKVKNVPGAKTGNTVVLELGKTTHAAAYFFAFILPVIALFLFAYAGHLLSQRFGVIGLDAASGLAGFIVSLLYSLQKIHNLDKASHLFVSKIITDVHNRTLTACPEETDYLDAFSKKQTG
jgi:positive regulator of sigma E activity